MGSGRDVGRRSVAILTALSFLISPATPLLAAPAQAPATTPAGGPAPKPTAAAKPAAAASPRPPSASPKPHDGGWPRGYVTPSGGKIVVYQPQVASWENQNHMVAYAAVSYDKGARSPPWAA